MSAKGSSAFGAGLSFGGALALSAAGKASADFCVPLAAGARAGATNFSASSDAGAECGTLGAGCAAETTLAGGTFVPVGGARGSVFAAAAGSGFAGAAACSAFAAVTAGSDFSRRGAGASPTGDGTDELPAPFAGAGSVGRAAGARFAGAPAGMIGGGIDGRGGVGRSGRGSGLAGAGRAGPAACAAFGDAGAVSTGAGLGVGADALAGAGGFGA